MIPVSYNYRNLMVRWKTTLMTACGFTLVVAALVVMLAFVNGIARVCDDTGDPRNVIVLSKGNTDEVLSRIDMRTVLEVENLPQVRRNAQGRPLSSREIFLVVTQPQEEAGRYQQLQARGVFFPEALDVHTKVKLSEGRMLRPGLGEVIVGRRTLNELGLAIGDQKQIGRKHWTIVGAFDAGGSMFESEFWFDYRDLSDHFRRGGTFTSLVVRTDNPADARNLSASLAKSRRVSVEGLTEVEHYAKQAEQTNVIYTGGITIACFMAIGAVFGVANTMFAVIAQRIKDIAILRLLGFRRREIMISFLLEAMLIALIGGVLGSALGYGINGFTLSFSMGAKSVAFAFTVDQQTIVLGALFTVAMGILGGIAPAWSAMRVDPLSSLR